MGDQRCQFTRTQSRLQSMKHDPSVSIDDIISKMLTIPMPRKETVNSENTENSKQSILLSSSEYAPFVPFAQGSQLSQSGFEENGSLSFSDNQWNFGVPQSAPVPVAASTATTSVPPSFDGEESEFGSFTSCEPGILSPASTAASLAVPTSVISLAMYVGKCPLNQHRTPAELSPEAPSCADALEIYQDIASTILSNGNSPSVTEESPVAQTSPGVDDAFQDFQGCPVLEHEAFQQTEEGPLKDWLRCLDACLTMLTDSEAVLSALTTDDGINALLATPRGHEFILLIEIYGIVQRIRMASTLYNVLNLRLQSTFKQIDKVWSNLAHFVKTDTHKAALRRLLTVPGDSANQGITEFTQPAVDDKQLCGVCVTPVTLLPNSIIELAGHLYHPSCANLWVNKIQLSLPALCPP